MDYQHASTSQKPFSEDRPSRAFLREARRLAEQDAPMRMALFGEALRALLVNDFVVLKKLLRMLIHCTVGFEPLAIELGYSSKSLLRMLSANGNPTTKNLMNILNAIGKHQAISLELFASIPGMQDHPYRIQIEPTRSRSTSARQESTL